MANAFVAHAQTRIADSKLAAWPEHLSLPASNMAREEYGQAHALYTALLDTSPAHYSAKRQVGVHKVAVNQHMRPVPLQLSAADALAASIGVGA